MNSTIPLFKVVRPDGERFFLPLLEAFDKAEEVIGSEIYGECGLLYSVSDPCKEKNELFYDVVRPCGAKFVDLPTIVAFDLAEQIAGSQVVGDSGVIYTA